MKLLVFLSVFLLLAISTASANVIGVINPPTDTIRIMDWTESNSVNGKDLNVNIVIQMVVNKNILKFYDYYEFELWPEEIYASGFLPARDIKFQVCEGQIGGYNFGEEIPINCIKNISFKNTSNIRMPSTGYKNYRLNISLRDINWSFYDSKRIAIKINYVLPNFVKEGIEKLLFFDTDCFPSDCPSPKMITKSITLPKYAFLRVYPKDTKLIEYGDKLVLIFNDFSPYSPFHGRYDTKTVLYTDLNEERKDKENWLRRGVVLGLVLTLIAELMIWFLFKKDKEYQLLSDVSNIKIKINSNTRMINSLNSSLKRIQSSIKNVSKYAVKKKNKLKK